MTSANLARPDGDAESVVRVGVIMLVSVVVGVEDVGGSNMPRANGRCVKVELRSPKVIVE